jgi:hypothetical protein
MKFKIGEVVILRNTVYFPQYEGCEVEIIQDIRTITSTQDGKVVDAYEIKILQDDKVLNAQTHQLKRKPPNQDTTTWEEFKKVCGFDPSKVTV